MVCAYSLYQFKGSMFAWMGLVHLDAVDLNFFFFFCIWSNAPLMIIKLDAFFSLTNRSLVMLNGGPYSVIRIAFSQN